MRAATASIGQVRQCLAHVVQLLQACVDGGELVLGDALDLFASVGIGFDLQGKQFADIGESEAQTLGTQDEMQTFEIVLGIVPVAIIAAAASGSSPSFS